MLDITNAQTVLFYTAQPASGLLLLTGIQFEQGTKEKGAPSVWSRSQAEFGETGIDITTGKITLTADNTTFQTSSGDKVAVFNADGINADIITAEKLNSVGPSARVSIENGLLEVFGSNGIANIRFGLDAEGNAILSYYDKNGKWLYDLGPNKLNGSNMVQSRLDKVEYVDCNLIDDNLNTNNTVTPNGYNVVDRGYLGTDSSWFGWMKYPNDGNKENSERMREHLNYKPGDGKRKTTFWVYTAGRIQGTIVKDDAMKLTAALAEEADGKIFSSTHISDGTKLINVVTTGQYIKPNAHPSLAPVSSDSMKGYPVYRISITDFAKGVRCIYSNLKYTSDPNE